MLRAHRDHWTWLLEKLGCQSPPAMAAHVESPDEKIVSDQWTHHVRKIFRASRSDQDVSPNPQDTAQRVLRREAAKDVAGADE